MSLAGAPTHPLLEVCACAPSLFSCAVLCGESDAAPRVRTIGVRRGRAPQPRGVSVRQPAILPQKAVNASAISCMRCTCGGARRDGRSGRGREANQISQDSIGAHARAWHVSQLRQWSCVRVFECSYSLRIRAQKTKLRVQARVQRAMWVKSYVHVRPQGSDLRRRANRHRVKLLLITAFIHQRA